MIVNKNFISGQVLNASDLNTIVSGLNSIEYKLPNVSTTDIIEEQKKLQTIIDDVKKKVTNLTQYVHENDVAVIKHSLSLLEDAVSKYRADLDYAKLKIDGHESTFESLKNEFNKKLDDANELLNQNQEKIQETITKLEDAKDALDEAKKTLDDLAGSGEAGATIESALARIREFAEWYDENKEYINSYQQIVDMVDGYKEEILQHIDTSNETITGIRNRLNAAEGSIEEVVEKIDTQDDTIVTLGSRISANEEYITQYGERIDTNNSSITKVSADLNALTGKYNITASRVATNTDDISQAFVDINGINSAIEQHASSIKVNESSISEVSTKLDAVDATITTKVSTAVGDKFTSIDETIDGFSAKIDRVSSYIDGEFESVVEEKVNAQLGEIKTQIETANALSGRVTQVETDLLAADAKITSAVTLVETADDKVTSVRSDLSALTGEFGVLSSKVDANDAKVAEFKVGYDKINSIVTEDGKVSNTAIDVDGIVSSVVNHNDIKTMSSNITQNANNISMIVNSGTQTEGTWTPNVDPATIIASITENDNKTLTSSIVLSADTIALTGKTVVDNLNAMDITVGGGSTKFNQNGSGYTANGNISWDETGNVNGVTIHNTEGIYVYMPSFKEDLKASEIFSPDNWAMKINDYVCMGSEYNGISGFALFTMTWLGEYTYIWCHSLKDYYDENGEKVSNGTILPLLPYDTGYNVNNISGNYIDGKYILLFEGEEGLVMLCGTPYYDNVNKKDSIEWQNCTITNKKQILSTLDTQPLLFKHSDNYYCVFYDHRYTGTTQGHVYNILKSKDCITWDHIQSELETAYDPDPRHEIGVVNGDLIIPYIDSNDIIQIYFLRLSIDNYEWDTSNHDYSMSVIHKYHNNLKVISGNAKEGNYDDLEHMAVILYYGWGADGLDSKGAYAVKMYNNETGYGYVLYNEFPINKYQFDFSKIFIAGNHSNKNLKYTTLGNYTYINTTPYMYSRKHTKMHLGDINMVDIVTSDGSCYCIDNNDVLYKSEDVKVDLVDLIFSKLM